MTTTMFKRHIITLKYTSFLLLVFTSAAYGAAYGISDITVRSVKFGGTPYRSTRFKLNSVDEPAGHSTDFATHANHDNGRFHCRRYRDRGWNILVISLNGTQIGVVQSFDS